MGTGAALTLGIFLGYTAWAASALVRELRANEERRFERTRDWLNRVHPEREELLDLMAALREKEEREAGVAWLFSQPTTKTKKGNTEYFLSKIQELPRKS